MSGWNNVLKCFKTSRESKAKLRTAINTNWNFSVSFLGNIIVFPGIIATNLQTTKHEGVTSNNNFDFKTE